MKTRANFLTGLVRKNYGGVCSFIEEMLLHDGCINFQHLHKVLESHNRPKLVRCSKSENNNRHAILMGGEVANSFCPLYEAAYFFQALFLSACGTLFLSKSKTEKLKGLPQAALRKKIGEAVSGFEEKELAGALEKPAINIVCSLDTDIEPYRYVKHQLWRLPASSLKKRCCEIGKDELGREPLDKTLKEVYWIEEDVKIAANAMRYAETLPEAKALQYYATMKEISARMGLDVCELPGAEAPGVAVV